MKQVDMIAIEKINGEIKVSDKWSKSNNTPPSDTQLGRNRRSTTDWLCNEGSGWLVIGDVQKKT